MLVGVIKPLVAALALSGCIPVATGGATESAICNEWFESLPTRSRADTAQTQNEIQRAYAVQDAVCG